MIFGQHLKWYYDISHSIPIIDSKFKTMKRGQFLIHSGGIASGYKGVLLMGLPKLVYQLHYVFCTKPCNAQPNIESLFAGASCDPSCNMQAAEKLGQSGSVQHSCSGTK